MASARKCAPALVPKKIAGPRATSAKAATRSSSAFSTAVAPGHGRFSISSRSASAISSIEAKNSRCSTATRVTTPISGEAIRVRCASSPRCDIPSSTTAASYSLSSFRSVSGRPYSLFRFPCVFSTRSRAPTSAARISLVVVFPTDPATPAMSRPGRCLPPDLARPRGQPLQSAERVVHGEHAAVEFLPDIPRDARAPPTRPQRLSRGRPPHDRVRRDAVRVWRRTALQAARCGNQSRHRPARPGNRARKAPRHPALQPPEPSSTASRLQYAGPPRRRKVPAWPGLLANPRFNALPAALRIPCGAGFPAPFHGRQTRSSDP